MPTDRRPLPALRRRLRRTWRDLLAVPRSEATDRLWSEVRAGHPGFAASVAADARITASNRGERFEHRSGLDAALQALRLALVTDAFLAQCCYRAKAALQARGVPFLPRPLHRLAVTRGQVVIGDPVVVEAGVFVPHGQVCIDGMTRIGSGTVIGPFVTIGLVSGEVVGPTIGERVRIGTGARVLGPVRVGDGASIGANAVVVDDVPPGATVVGVPARPVRPADPAGPGPRGAPGP